MEQQNKGVIAERMRLIFEEWLKRSLDERCEGPRLHYYRDGVPIGGEAYAEEFVKIAKEMDAASRLPLPRAAAAKPAAEPAQYFNIEGVPDGYSVQQVTRNKYAVIEKDVHGVRIVRCHQEGISSGLQLIYPSRAKADEVCKWLLGERDENSVENLSGRVRSLLEDKIGTKVNEANVAEIAKELADEMTEALAPTEA